MRAALLLLVLACNSKNDETTAKYEALVETGPYTDVQADYLARVYANNPISADDTYKGQALRVTGVVTTITTDNEGVPLVGLGDGKDTNYAVCVWGKHTSDAKWITRRELVTLKGIGAGLADRKIPMVGFCALDLSAADKKR